MTCPPTVGPGCATGVQAGVTSDCDVALSAALVPGPPSHSLTETGGKGRITEGLPAGPHLGPGL